MLYQFKGTDDFSHVYLICRFGHCLLIDPSHSYETILEKLSDQMLDGILITHAHSDHVHLIHHFNVPIYMSHQDASLLFDDKHNGYHEMKRPFLRKDLNIVIVKDQDEIKLSDKVVKVIETPGHTKGSLSFLFENYLFTGDTLFKNDIGRYDLYTGNLFDLKRSVMKLIDSFHNNTVIYPGHDDKSTIREEKRNHPFYIKWKKQGKI